jgi:hypothetical protein
MIQAGDKNSYKIVFRKSGSERSFRRPKHILEDDIKMHPNMARAYGLYFFWPGIGTSEH